MFNSAIQKLIEQFQQLPGVGEKSAQRMAFFMVKQGNGKQKTFAQTLEILFENVCYCTVCQNFSDTEVCGICKNDKRNQRQICIVEGPFDAMAIEKTSHYDGVYHILHGVLSPIDNVKPDDLKITELITRIQNNGADEIIFALSPTLEGEATAHYITKYLPTNIKTTHLARGLPTGASLEYSDEITIARALRDRH